MGDEIIGMEDMQAVYEITDLFDIDRETISVPLEKGPSGSVEAADDGSFEIIVPAGIPIRDWLPALQSGIEALGFSIGEGEPDSDW